MPHFTSLIPAGSTATFLGYEPNRLFYLIAVARAGSARKGQGGRARRSRGRRPVPARVAGSRERRAGRPRVRRAPEAPAARRFPEPLPAGTVRCGSWPLGYRPGSGALTRVSVPALRGRGFGRGQRQRGSVVGMPVRIGTSSVVSSDHPPFDFSSREIRPGGLSHPAGQRRGSRVRAVLKPGGDRPRRRG